MVISLALAVAVHKLGLDGASAELENQLRLARQEGLAVEPEDLQRPPVPVDQNAAYAILNAFDAAKKLPDNPLGVVTDSHEKKPSDDQIRIALKQLEPILKVIDEVSHRPHFDLRWDWNTGREMAFPEFEAVRRLNRCLLKQAHIGIADGRFIDAGEWLLASANLSRLLSEQTTNYSFYLRIRTESSALAELESLLRRAPKDRRYIQTSRRVLAALGSIPDLRATLGTDLVMDRIFYHQAPYWNEMHSTSSSDTLIGGPATYLLRFKSVADLNDANLVKSTRAAYNLFPKDATEYLVARKALRAMPNDEGSSTDPEGLVRGVEDLGHLLSTFTFDSRDLDGWARCIARRRVFAAGVDILDQALKTGAFPITWVKSGPEGIDPFSDKPLIYRRTKNGFVIYSLDVDQKDDGGRPYARGTGSDNTLDISFEYPKLSVDPKAKR